MSDKKTHDFPVDDNTIVLEFILTDKNDPADPGAKTLEYAVNVSDESNWTNGDMMMALRQAAMDLIERENLL